MGIYSWAAVASLPATRSRAFGGTINGIGYVAGGYDGSEYATVYAYDPASDTWTSKANMPAARSWGGSAVIGGQLYAIGGQNGPSAKNEAYDPATNTWTAKASLPAGRLGCGCAPLNGTVYVAFGSAGGSTYLNSLYAYDPAANAWSQKASASGGRSAGAMVATSSALVYFGGYNGARLDETLAYDPSVNAWTAKAKLPAPRSNHFAAMLGSNAIIAGGRKGSESTTTASCLWYAPATDTFSPAPDMPSPRELAAVCPFDTFFVVAGGEMYSPSVTYLSSALKLSINPNLCVKDAASGLIIDGTLDLGHITAGKASAPKGLLAANQLGGAVDNVRVSLSGDVSPDQVELSKSSDPFIAESPLIFDSGPYPAGADIGPFYVRVKTDAASSGVRHFTLRITADTA